jgi:hypothetical protein
MQGQYGFVSPAGLHEGFRLAGRAIDAGRQRADSDSCPQPNRSCHADQVGKTGCEHYVHSDWAKLIRRPGTIDITGNGFDQRGVIKADAAVCRQVSLDNLTS